MPLFDRNVQKGKGNGMGMGKRGGRGIEPGKQGADPAGDCVCLSCGEKVAHKRGVPCFAVVCPKCGAKMTRNR